MACIGAAHVMYYNQYSWRFWLPKRRTGDDRHLSTCSYDSSQDRSVRHGEDAADPSTDDEPEWLAYATIVACSLLLFVSGLGMGTLTRHVVPRSFRGVRDTRGGQKVGNLCRAGTASYGSDPERRDQTAPPGSTRGLSRDHDESRLLAYRGLLFFFFFLSSTIRLHLPECSRLQQFFFVCFFSVLLWINRRTPRPMRFMSLLLLCYSRHGFTGSHG